MSLATTTIPPGWGPASSCQNGSDNWLWRDNIWGMGVLGPPDHTSSCYPPNFTPTLGQLYTASACPDGFTPACTTNYYSSSWSTLCCPSGDQYYTCNHKSFWSWTAACATSIHSYTNYVTKTYTSFGNSARSTDGTFVASGYSVLVGSSTISTDLTTTGTFSYVYAYKPDQTIFALGVPILPPASKSNASASSSVPSTTGYSSTSSLSAGASAGIAIGALIAIIFIALGIWLLYRRGVNKRRAGGDNTEPSGQHRSPEEQQQPKPGPEEYIPQRSPVEVHDADFRRYELDDPRNYPELPELP